MTTVARSFEPSTELGPELGSRELHRGLVAILRRRVPAGEVDDVAQTVLCDALASESVPADPVEVRRWIAGIARHKVADYHRQAARTARVVVTERRADGEAVAEPVTDPAPFEEREILAGVLRGTRTGRERETMEWLVREHAGERLSEIATESGVPAAVVRQRVSRLRRALRTRWGGLLVILLLAGSAAVAAGLAGRQEEVALIGPDPSVAPPRAPALARLPADGDWMVERVSADKSIPPALRKLVDVEAPNVVLRVRGDRVDVTGKTFQVSRRIASMERGARGELSFLVVGGAGDAPQRMMAVIEGDRMAVTTEQGKLQGTVVLRRAAP